MITYHHEVWLNHLELGREVEPDLEEARGIRSVLMNQWEHFSVHDPLAGGHPLKIPLAIPPGIPFRICMIDHACNRRSDGLKASEITSIK